jgi:hypothetical protein
MAGMPALDSGTVDEDLDRVAVFKDGGRDAGYGVGG